MTAGAHPVASGTSRTPRLDVWVPGRPITQGSMKPGRKGWKRDGAPVVVKDNGPDQQAWRAAIVAAVLRHYRRRPTPLTGPVRVDIEFVLPRPVRTPTTRPTPAAIKKPDGDKLLRCAWDGLTDAGVWGDDAQVIAWSGSKRIAEHGEAPGARIRIDTPRADGPR